MEETPVVEAVNPDGNDLTPKSVTGIVHRMTDMVSLRKELVFFSFEEHSSIGTLSNWSFSLLRNTPLLALCLIGTLSGLHF